MAMAVQCTGRVSQQVSLSRASTRASAPVLPLRPLAKRAPLVVRAQATAEKDVQAAVTKAAAFGTAVSTFLAAGNAHAATELMQLSAGDGRAGILAALFLPALGWVAFNIAQPALNQLSDMADAQPAPKKRAVATGLGLTAASLLAAQSADAAEIMQLADGDSRLGILAALFLPAIGWVAFNIAQPALNQVSNMADKASDKPAPKKKRAVATGLGLTAASLLAAQSADAAEVMQLAAGDGRAGILAALFLPALAWVAFNIAQPALNQLSDMADAQPAPKKRAVATGLGLTAASLLAAQSADAAEIMQLADGDSRLFILAALFLPAIGWVAFNIAQPALNQVSNMADKASEKPAPKKKRAVATGLGLTAASLLAAQSADAAEVMQLAAGDGRVGILATLFLPALAWVVFNIAQPALTQLDSMKK